MANSSDTVAVIDPYYVLAEAHSLRRCHVGDDTLVAVSGIPPCEGYPPTVWTAVAKSGTPPPRIRWAGNGSFRANFALALQARGDIAIAALNIIFDALGPKSGLYVAGGSVCRTLIGACPERCTDIDLFCVGESDLDVQSSVIALLEQLAKVAPLRYGLTVHCLNVVIDGGPRELKLQIILRRYSTFAEVLHGFDLGSPSVGYDGEMVYSTPLGAFAMTCGYNLVDLSTRRYSYEQRIVKYMEMGFALLLDAADAAKLSGEAESPEPSSPWRNRTRVDDSIRLGRLTLQRRSSVKRSDGRVFWIDYNNVYAGIGEVDWKTEGYTAYVYPSRGPLDPGDNIRRLFAGAERETPTYLRVSPDMHPWAAADPLPGGLRACTVQYWARACRQLQGGKQIPEAFLDLLPDTVLAKILRNRHVDFDTEIWPAVRSRAENAADLARVPRVRWAGVESGTNLIGPFTVDPASEVEWYGKFYKPFEAETVKPAKRSGN